MRTELLLFVLLFLVVYSCQRKLAKDEAMHQLANESVKSDITLEKNGFRQDEVKRATAYSKDKQKLFVLKNVLDNDPSHAVPLIVYHNKICEDDLWFETKVDLNS